MSLSKTTRSIWTILLSVIVWIVCLAMKATKATLICVISVAMWLPMCLTANTAVAADSNTASTVASSGNSDKKADNSSDKAKDGKKAGKASDKVAGKAAGKANARSANNPNASNSADTDGADTADISAPSQTPVFVDGPKNAFAKLQMQNGVNNNLSNSAAKGDGSVKGLIDSAMMSAAEGMASQSGAYGAFVNTDRASSGNRSSNSNRDSNRNSKMEFRPGCYKEYARSECITDDGDKMGHRASNGADMERRPNPWSTVYSNFASPQGIYTENDPNFTPYPRGTYLQKRLRNLPYDAGKSGVDPLAFNQLDDVHDYIFMKRTPKRDGSGYIWDVLVNMGARIHGAAKALTYFVVPKDQKLDASNGQYDQYVERLHFNADNRNCGKNWVNPNGFCTDEGTVKTPLEDSETLDKAWTRLGNGGTIESVGVFEGGTQSRRDDKNRKLGLCESYGFDCYHSTNYAFPSDGEHKGGTRLPPDGSQRFNDTYIKLIDNLFFELRGPDEEPRAKIFALRNQFDEQKSPYSYHIHYTTSDNGQYGKLSTSYYGAGTYYGNTWHGPGTRYGQNDPYQHNKKYSLADWRLGKGHTTYEYTTLYQQWYGIPNLVDMRVPHFQFLRGTHLGPLTSNNGQLLAKTNNIGVASLLFRPSRQRVCEGANEDQCTGKVWAKGQISLYPKYNSADNKYARGNRWWRNPLDPNTHINTQDSSFGPHQMTVKYWNDKLQMGSSMPFKYDIIGQADVFRPLQTEEWDGNAKYRSQKDKLKNPLDYVQYLDKKGDIYEFAHDLNPRLYWPDSHSGRNISLYKDYSDANETVYYGSIKDGKNPNADDHYGLEYPLTEAYNYNDELGASKAIKDRAIYSVDWTDEKGSVKKSDTLQDAETKIAVKVPVVNVVDPCEGDDDKAADNAADNDAEKSAEDDANKDGGCKPQPLKNTKRYIWKLYDAPQGKSVDQKLSETEKTEYYNRAVKDFSKPVKEEYATPTNSNNDNRIMMQSDKQPEVKPVYVLAKYAKITYWDESKDVLPLVFTHIDSEKPTIDVNVSVDGGEPQSVPESGLNVSVGSRVRFLVTGHDDMHVHMGTKENVPHTNSTDVLEASKKWHNSFSKYDQSKQACGKTACVDTLKDQSGYVTTNDPNGSPASANDGPSKEFTFHAWDDAGNNVQKTVKLNIIDGNFIVPNVRWQKQNDGKYVGKVTLSKNATSVKMLVVRIWGRGKTKPFEEKNGTQTDIYRTCNARTDGCQGIMLHRQDEKHDWTQLNSQNDTTFTKIMPYEKEITFNPKTGEITIPENLTEIGSRIYVGIGRYDGTINTSDHAVSQPLPLEMKWPDDGMVQVSPYELNPSEKQGLIDRIKQKNPRLFDYRKDEIGWSKDETKYLGGKSDKYSCANNTKQYKICLSVTPDGKNTGQNKSGSEKTFNVVKATGTGTDTQDDQKQETVLDPKQKKITRFVNIRADYDWSYGSGKINGRNTDDGFMWYGRDENSTQFLVYRFNINQGKNFNTNDALSLFKGTKKKWLKDQIQPSLYDMFTGKDDATSKIGVEGAWNNGWNGLPKRAQDDGNNARSYAKCPLHETDKNKKCSEDSQRGEWVNIVDLVNENLGGAITIDTNNITDKNSSLQPQGYLMPGGEGYNQQASGANLGSAILKNGQKTPIRTQLYIFNGRPWKDLEARGEGDKTQTPNVINVWFVPVDKNKPWISLKDANKKLLGECNPTKDKADSCGTATNIDMNKTDITKQSGLFNVVDLLAMDDDFNVANPETHVSEALKNTLSIDIEADGVGITDPKTKKAPRVRFVTGGNINKELLRAFIEKWRGNDATKSPTFKMIAQVTDDSRNKSNEAVVGKFKFTWTVAKAPIVRAYDGHHYGDSSKSVVWLHDWEGAVADRYYNAVSVVAGENATRLVVYFTRALQEKSASLQSNNSNNLMYSFGAQSSLSSNNAASASDTDTSEALALCKSESTNKWEVCEGYTLPQGATLNSNDEGKNNSAIIFNLGILAPGSVVRARDRAGSYGPWSYMPGVKSGNLDELSNNTNSSQSGDSENPTHVSSSVDSNSTNNDASNVLKEKEEDMRNVLSADSMVAQRSNVCRPETKAPKEWNSPSDCVFFPVVVNKKVVQVHPLLLNDSEKRAVNHVLRNGNAGGKWLGFGDADRLISVDDNDTLSANQSEVAWKRGQYVAPTEQKDKRNNYSDAAGNEQDSFILLRGWRRRNVTPEPRYNVVTRFARLRSVGNSDADSADYTITWDKKKPYIGERSSDPGFELVGAPGHQSLVYRYNASSSGQIGLGDLQNALKLMPVKLEEATKNKTGKELQEAKDAFAKIQPSLRVVNGTDKGDAEHNENGFKRPGFFTLNDEFTNAPDLVTANGYYGGGNSVSVRNSNNGMSASVLKDKYKDMAPKSTDIPEWGIGDVNSSKFTLDKVLGGLDGIKYVNNSSNSSHYVLSLSNRYARESLQGTYGYEAKSDFSDIAGAQSILPVYVVPIDVIKPKVKAKGSLQTSTMDKPYEVTANDIKFTFTGNPDANGKVKGKELLVDTSDDFDSRDVVEKNLQVCVRWMNNNKPQDKDCTPILKRDNSGNASVDSEALQRLLITNRNTAVYAVYAQTKDKSENKSEHYDAGKDDANAIIGYIKITGINVSPIPLPFTGGNAAITYTFLFGILMALFIASGAFGRRGWLASVLSGNGISGELTYSKHCNASAESLRCGRLFGGRKLFGIIYKNRH
ncbi:cell wall-binding protein [Gardnerella vaginalis]|uniref:cell wall-binding protein n=1 Tax=Gardnerella vaginalis TaxID=2702 RepID=UPI0039F0260C